MLTGLAYREFMQDLQGNCSTMEKFENLCLEKYGDKNWDGMFDALDSIVDQYISMKIKIQGFKFRDVTDDEKNVIKLFILSIVTSLMHIVHLMVRKLYLPLF